MVGVADDGALRLLEFCLHAEPGEELSVLQRRFAAVVETGQNAVVDQLGAELDAYFAGTSAVFRTPIAIEGTPFQVRVWRALLRIGPGRTMSYSDLAAAIGSPAARRAVGGANGQNRLALIVPCHRVIRGDGSICGYGGGVWRKRWLLDHEATFRAEPVSGLWPGIAPTPRATPHGSR